MFSGGRYHFTHQVAAAIVPGIEIRETALVEPKTLVVHGGENQVFHAALHSQLTKLLGIKAAGLELLG